MLLVRRARCRSALVVLLVVTALVALVAAKWWVSSFCLCTPGNARESPKQATASVMRERGGLGIGGRVTDAYSQRPLSQSESSLAGRLKKAGLAGNWKQVCRLYQEYTGTAVPVHGAAMQAAYRCGRFKEAADMYRNLREVNNAGVNQVILVHGIKIFGKLNDKRSVEAIWAEVMSKGWINKFLATARIDAASEMGDIVGAASVLEALQNSSSDLDAVQYSSAINACKNSDENASHVAATFLLSRMIDDGLQPNIVTFTSFAGAHRRAPLIKIKLVLSFLSEQKVTPNSLFVETFLGAIFRGRLKDAWSVADVAERIKGTSPNRMQFARSFLDDVAAQGVTFSKLTSLTHKCLQQRA